MRKTTLLLSIVLFAACGKTYTPRPYGYFRISFPEHKYQLYQHKEPYSFQISEHAKVEADSSERAEEYWLNVVYPAYKANIHISYKTVSGNIAEILEDTRTLAYKHSVKADAIDEELVKDKNRNVYGLIYSIRGNAASPIQFYLTDSIKHYVRGALYFNVPPNKDSLAPVVDYIRKDVRQLINTLSWK